MAHRTRLDHRHHRGHGLHLLGIAAALHQLPGVLHHVVLRRHQRRHARLLCGSQDLGDEYVQVCLELYVQEPERIDSGDLRVSLFRLFHSVWTIVNAKFGAASPHESTEPGDRLEKGLQELAPLDRPVLLLKALEGFNTETVAHILNLTVPQVEEGLARAQQHLRKWSSVDILIIEDERIIAFELEELVREMGHRVVGTARREREAQVLARFHGGVGLPSSTENEDYGARRTTGAEAKAAIGRLVAQAQTPLRTVDLDVLDSENAHTYWARAHKHDTVLNLNFAGDGLDAFCRVLEAWVAHMLEVRVGIEPVQQITDERWVWHVGLDKEASRLLDDLWHGAEVGEARLARLLSLFRLEFKDPSVMIAGIQGRPVYLALMMTEDKRLKLKPQNLLLNLPLAERA